MRSSEAWAEAAARFMDDGAVGWIMPDGMLVPTALHGHIEALRADRELRALLPESIDWEGNSLSVMDAVYGAGWGRTGTWSSNYHRGIELECFLEHARTLRRHAKELAEVVGRTLTVSPVFTREDRLRVDPTSAYRREKKLRRAASPLKAVAEGLAVGWLSPQGEICLGNPCDPLGFLRSGAGKPGLESMEKWLKEADGLFETWQSNQFAEHLDPDEHPEWHRFYADDYVAPPEVLEEVRQRILSRGWGFVERAEGGALKLDANPGCDASLRARLASLAEVEGLRLLGGCHAAPGIR